MSELATECETGRGYIDHDGYARTAGKKIATKVYIAANGPIPDGLELDHLCRNRACVNVQHLEAVTHLENMRRATAARTHCPQGHEFVEENCYYWVDAKGYRLRMCRTCRRERRHRVRIEA